MSEILTLEGVSKSFGGLKAVDDVSLKVKENEVHVIIGPNGAGKTTLFNLITGFLKPDKGKIIFMGKDITGLPPHRLCGLGIARSFQIFNLFQNLTVLESIRLAVQSRKPSMKKDFIKDAYSYKDTVWEAMRISAMVGLWSKNNLLVSSLTPSDKRKLEIAISLACEPKLLALDEPASGISIEELDSLVNLLTKIKKERKVTILMIEHKIDIVLKLADVITVMNQGRVIAEGSPQEIVENQEVKKVYLGE